jgi:hypothetical protein
LIWGDQDMASSDGRLVLRIPPELELALARAARNRLTTVSEYVRQAVLNRLQEDGLPAPTLKRAGPSATPVAGKKMLSPREVAEMLGMTPGSLANWRVTGGGPVFVRIGTRKIMYRSEDVEAFISGGVRTSTSDVAA